MVDAQRLSSVELCRFIRRALTSETQSLYVDGDQHPSIVNQNRDRVTQAAGGVIAAGTHRTSAIGT